MPGQGNIWETPISFVVISSSRKSGERTGTLFTPTRSFGSSSAPALIAAFSFIRIRSRIASSDGLSARAASTYRDTGKGTSSATAFKGNTAARRRKRILPGVMMPFPTRNVGLSIP
jgi:hypothetical protein